MELDIEKERLAEELKGSLLTFTKMFYELLTGRKFIVSNPLGRESHHITVCRALTDLFRNQHKAHGLVVNMPPGYGKSVMTSMWVAWCYAHYPDCNFLYISYAHELAASHTAFIKQIMSCEHYKYLFDVHISRETRAKDHFMTTAGGCIAAFGSSGPVTGRNAGAPGLDRFSGCVVIDDAHKPSEVYSDSIRNGVIKNYSNTILQRPRDVRVPILFIGQCLHEDDLAAYFKSGRDVRKWDSVVLPGIDIAGNALYPEVQPLSYLKEMEEKESFVFHSQIQQNPIPTEGSLFKKDNFRILDLEPEILYTFITADTAETDKTYNDATAFSFWGIYKIDENLFGLHWLDAQELFIEPKDLQDAFMDFWADCRRHPVKPLVAAIEKKSTGSTLISVLKEVPGIQIRDIPRDRSTGSKTTRFIECQKYIASKLVSFTRGAKHVDMCIEHMSKITANDAHRRDDLADTAADAIKLALIDKTLYHIDNKDSSSDAVMSQLAIQMRKQQQLRTNRNVLRQT